MTHQLSDLDLLRRAIAEVGASEQSMAKLARAAVTRPNCEGEWVYEIDGTMALGALEPGDVAREVPFGKRQRADLRIRSTLIEFKSTKPWYAESGGLEILDPPPSPKKDCAQSWLGPDIRRMAAITRAATAGGTSLKTGAVVTAGAFVLLVSSDGAVGTHSFKDDSPADVRTKGLELYRRWLQDYTEKFAPGAIVDEPLPAGHGTYRGTDVFHDALIVHWPQG
jgi:hypothetical protein